MMGGRKRFPWKIGATSFVLPAPIADNVLYLADMVDDVQLLFFESPSPASPPNEVPVRILQQVAARSGIGFTAHLPVDIRPGGGKQERARAVTVVTTLMEMLAPLSPRCYDLHLPLEHDLERNEWLDNLDGFLHLLATGIGQQRRQVAIENIDYPASWIRPLVRDHGYSLCLDVGHALLFADDPAVMLADLAGVRHIHYHGVLAGRDHQALHARQQPVTAALGSALLADGYDGVVTLEIYNPAALRDSLAHLETVWAAYVSD